MLAVLGFGRRAGWGVADQTLSSLTNFALGIVVARHTSTEAFGAFALAFVTYLLLLNLGRAIVAQPLLIRFSAQSAERWADAAGRGVAVSIVFGTSAGFVCTAFGFVIAGNVGAALLGLGLSIPGLLLQDAWRFAFFAAGRDRAAFFNDAVWVAVLLPAFAALMVLGSASLFEFVLAWGVAATVAAAIGFLQAAVRPQFGAVRAWFRVHADLIPRYATETVVRVGSLLLTYYFVGLIGGLGVAGAIRAGELILGPFNILAQGVHLVAVPEAVRMLRSSRAQLARWCWLLSVVLAAAAFGFGIVCMTIPPQIGQTLLGPSWAPARSVLLPLTAVLGGTFAAAGGGVGLRALGAPDRILRAGLVLSIATLVAAIGGVWWGGAVGAAAGMAIGTWIGAAAFWLEMRAALRDVSGHAAESPSTAIVP